MREIQGTFGDFLLKKRKEQHMTIKDITKRLERALNLLRE